jgi:YgiT-type zinc finger domain-containing protein
MPYSTEVKHNGKLHTVTIEEFTAPRCSECGEVFFTAETDDQVSAALRDLLGLLQPVRRPPE